MVLPASHGISRVPRYSGTTSREIGRVSDTGLSPSLAVLSWILLLHADFVTLRDKPRCRPTTPAILLLPVWAIPVSLAATRGITIVFFSSGYLDVSVHQVSL